MAVLIEDRETADLVKELSAATGESDTEAINHAVRERLERLRSREHRIAHIKAIATRVAELPELDPRSADEIIGYNEHGLFD
ncbi:MAG TPA: type II toxin-antitoxin system VapB family antitoxin [Acidobacteriaceae bacterium]|jgi:antitoxin VapB